MLTRDIEDLHREACEKNLSCYTDPSSGLIVFTAHFLRTRPCCGCGCRHCPWPKDKSRAPSSHMLFGKVDDLPGDLDVLFWSGGKDSYLALRSMQRENVRPILLLTTYGHDSGTVAHQEISIDVIQRQASSLRIPILAVPLAGGSGDYVDHVRVALERLRSNGIEIHRIAFGDLHLEHVRAWRDSHLASLGTLLHYPLWKRDYGSLLEELESCDFVIRVCAVAGDFARKGNVRVGDIFCGSFCKQLPEGVDAFGENGEFHTVVEVWHSKQPRIP